MTWIRLLAIASFTLYALALVLRTRTARAARLLWTAAFLLMVVHVLLAFAEVHHWSHQAAHDDTARQTAEIFGLRWGGGVFFNYALLLVWAVDVVRWWRGGFSICSQAFLAFMWFNGVVVFGHGWVRWFGAVVFLALGVLAWTSRRKRSKSAV
jgi:hypothetical protein